MLALDLLINDIGKTKVLTREEEKELLTRIKSGDQEAEKELVERNLRFVVSIAKRYTNKNIHLGDLVSEGTIGLIEAARRFDISKGVVFITYAIWWIKIRMRFHIHGILCEVQYPYRYNQAKAKLSTDQTEEEKSIIFSKSRINLQEIKDFVNMLALPDTFISIDAADDLPIGIEINYEWELDRHIENQRIKSVIAEMPEREATILVMRFGLYDKNDKPKTLQEIGDILGISRERVRQIEKKAKSKFRRIWEREAKNARRRG